MVAVPAGHDLSGLVLIPPQAWRPFHLVTLSEIDHELRRRRGDRSTRSHCRRLITNSATGMVAVAPVTICPALG
jgi:hypothetical protein